MFKTRIICGKKAWRSSRSRISLDRKSICHDFKIFKRIKFAAFGLGLLSVRLKEELPKLQKLLEKL